MPTKSNSLKNSKNTSVKKSTFPKGYVEFLADVKTRVRQAQLKASLSANRELVLLYWEIGSKIQNQQ